jgi:hypothetical protein
MLDRLEPLHQPDFFTFNVQQFLDCVSVGHSGLISTGIIWGSFLSFQWLWFSSLEMVPLKTFFVCLICGTGD